MGFLTELKRRNVLRVSAAYVVTAWLLIQIVETVFPAFGFGEAAVRITVIFSAIGLLPVAIFTWAFERTPEGIKWDKDVDRSGSTTPKTGKQLDRVIMVVLAFALGFFAVDKFVLSPERQAEELASASEAARQEGRSEALIESYGESSIAVLPFENMSNDSDNEYFSDGISEELLNLLSRIPRLRVISRTSSFAYKGKDLSIRDVAEQLNVALVLEGSVRKFGDQLRITAQLIEARSDTHLWSDTYTRKVDDLFAIQDEISAAIVEELKGKLNLDVGSAPTVTTVANTEAHDAYLRGRFLIEQRTPASKRGAVVEFEKAIALDPDFALAYAELAMAIMVGGKSESIEQMIVDAAAPVEKALSLGPGLAQAHLAKGFLVGWNADLYGDTGDEDGELAHYQRAIEINPNYYLAYHWMANALVRAGRHDEAFAANEMALRLDPLSTGGNFGYVNSLINRGRLDDADRQITKYAAIEPRGATLLRGRLTAIGGNWADLALSYLVAADNRPDDLVYGDGARQEFIVQLAMIGLVEEALRHPDNASPDYIRFFFGKREELLAEKQEKLINDPHNNPNEHYVLAQLFAATGQFDKAYPLIFPEHGLPTNLRFGFVSFESAFELEAAVATARYAGDEPLANNIVDEMRDTVRQNRNAGITQTRWGTSVDYYEGVAAYLAGDRGKALVLISKAALDGFYIPPIAAFFQQAMYEDPDFAAILDRQAIRLKRERARLLDVVCTDNPSPIVWQPTEKICERHFAVASD